MQEDRSDAGGVRGGAGIPMGTLRWWIYKLRQCKAAERLRCCWFDVFTKDRARLIEYDGVSLVRL